MRKNIFSPLSTTKWRLERQAVVSPLRAVLFKIGAIILALLIMGIIVESSGLEFGKMLKKVGSSTFGTSYGLQQLAILSTPIIIAGVSVIMAGQMKFINLGVEGQLYMGAWGGALIGLHVDGPPGLVIPAMFIAGALGGALWALLPAFLRIKLGLSEILTTLMLNFVAYQWVYYWVFGPWLDISEASLGGSAIIPYDLPKIYGQVTIGIIIALLLPGIFQLIMKNTVWGYEVTTIGNNRRAAEFAGMPYGKHMLIVAALAGGMAGFIGVIEITGTVHRLALSISQGYGFLGVMAGLLAENSFVALVPAALLMAIILNAGIVLKTQGLSFNAMLALTGLVLFLAAIAEVASKYKLIRTDTPPTTAVPSPSEHASEVKTTNPNTDK